MIISKRAVNVKREKGVGDSWRQYQFSRWKKRATGLVYLGSKRKESKEARLVVRRLDVSRPPC
jgi:hypothetical protein